MLIRKIYDTELEAVDYNKLDENAMMRCHITNDDELRIAMNLNKNITKDIDEYLDKNSTHEHNYYNEQFVIDYQDEINKYSTKYKDTTI